MYQYGKFILLTPLKEERQLIDLLVQACSLNVTRPSHRKTLEIVYHYLIEENRDLHLETLKSFIKLLSDLDLPKLELNGVERYGQIVGSRPRRIPSIKTDPEGHQDYLKKRMDRRRKFLHEALQEHKKGYGIFDQLKDDLTQINEKLDLLVDISKKLDSLLDQSRDSDGRIDEESLKKNILKLVVDNTKSA